MTRSDFGLVDNGFSDQDVSASLVLIICIGRVHRIKQVRGGYPNGRIFVTGNVKNEEAVCLRIVGPQGGDVPTTLLADRYPQIVDDNEAILLSEIFPGLGSKLIKGHVTACRTSTFKGCNASKPPS